MQNPRNLRVYGHAFELGVMVYQLTAAFPSSERFGLVAQMRRAVVSVGSNIAEGCGRNGNRALIACLHLALGSLDELEFQAELSEKLGFCSGESNREVSSRLVALRRGLVALISQLRRRPDIPEG